ncbi:MAG: hypothetical protein HY747_02765 [Elusimicrobia bacterium]|nr:hypothetical protein [Elusimicrobiota bacterium]
MPMEDLEKLEREKDAELAQLAAKIEQLETSARARQELFEKEAEQLRELFERSIQTLDSALGTSQERLSQEIAAAGGNLSAIEKRLEEIVAETSLPAIEAKIKAIEESIAQKGDITHLGRAEALSRQMKAFWGQVEERIKNKTEQISRLKEQLSLKEKETAGLAGRLETEKSALYAECRLALETKEKAAKEAVRSLETELAGRNLRVQEISKIVEARQIWLEHEKTRRLEAFKALLRDLESRSREFQQKLDEERSFWESRIKAMDQEIGSLNMRMVTGQAEIAAFKARSEQELKAMETGFAAEFEKRQNAWRLENKALKDKLLETENFIGDLTAKLGSAERSHRRELELAEAGVHNRELELKKEIEEREKGLEIMRREHSALLEKKTKELEAIKAEYEAKAVTPAFEIKRKHIEELAGKKEELEKRLREVKESGRLECLESETQLKACQEQIKSLQEKLSLEGRGHQQRLKDIAKNHDDLLAPYAAKLGELNKLIELQAAKHKDELAALEAKKANIHIEADHLRAAFEASVEEKRRDMIFAIENLKAQVQAQAARFEREKEQWQENLRSARDQAQKLDSQLESERSVHDGQIKEREQDIDKSRTANETKIAGLEKELALMTAEAATESQEQQLQIERLEAESRLAFEDLKKNKEAEQVALETRRTALLAAVNEQAEAFAAKRREMTLEADEVQQKLLTLEKSLEECRRGHEEALARLQERRAQVVAPLEAQAREMEERLTQARTESHSRLDIWTSRLTSLKADIEKRQADFIGRWQARKKDLTAEISGLEGKLSELCRGHNEACLRLEADKSQKEKDLAQKERLLGALSVSLAERRQQASTELEGRLAVNERALKKAGELLEKISAKAAALETQKRRELDALTGQLHRLEDEQAAQAKALEERYRQDKEMLEEKLKNHVHEAEKDLGTLNQDIRGLEDKIKDKAMELEVLRSQQDLELAEIARKGSMALSETRLKRAEEAARLRQIRRAFREKLREKEHEFYLARLKFEMRSKRLEEILTNKRHELERTKSLWADRAEQTISGLKSKIDGLVVERAAKTDKTKELEAKALEMKSRLESLRYGFSSPSDPSTSLGAGKSDASWQARERELIQAKAREQIEHFRKRLEDLLAAKEMEKTKMLEAAQAMEPISREASVTLTDFLLVWEREVRRMATLIKGIEESSFWRQH